MLHVSLWSVTCGPCLVGGGRRPIPVKHSTDTSEEHYTRRIVVPSLKCNTHELKPMPTVLQQLPFLFKLTVRLAGDRSYAHLHRPEANVWRSGVAGTGVDVTSGLPAPTWLQKPVTNVGPVWRKSKSLFDIAGSSKVLGV